MAFSKARRLGDLVTNVDGNLTAVEDIQLGADGFSELNINSTRTDGNIGGVKFRTNGTTKGAIFGTVAGDVSFTVNGEFTEPLRMKADGKIGIGTTSPSAKLHVQIDNDSGGIFADANTGLVLKNNSSTDDSAVTIAFQTNQGTGTMLQTVFPNADTNRHGELYVSTANSSGTLAERARFTHEGLKFPAGLGIDFQNTATGINSSSSTSALFDDYEEGTWTPTFAGVACAAVYGAHYVKIGQMVMAEAYIAGDTQNNSSQFRIAGLPYTAKNQTAYGGGSIGYTYMQDWTEIGAPLIPGNGSFIYFHRIDGSAGANSVINSYIYNKVTGNQLILFQVIYRAD